MTTSGASRCLTIGDICGGGGPYLIMLNQASRGTGTFGIGYLTYDGSLRLGCKRPMESNGFPYYVITSDSYDLNYLVDYLPFIQNLLIYPNEFTEMGGQSPYSYILRNIGKSFEDAPNYYYYSFVNPGVYDGAYVKFRVNCTGASPWVDQVEIENLYI